LLMWSMLSNIWSVVVSFKGESGGSAVEIFCQSIPSKNECAFIWGIVNRFSSSKTWNQIQKWTN
jgi:hypothetical protein